MSKNIDYVRINKNAKTKLKNGPARITENLAQTPLLLKEPSESSSISSPTMAQEPPIGNNFHEYFVMCAQSSLSSNIFWLQNNLQVIPFSVLQKVMILGPIPTENSVTSTPFFFASRKCPSS